MEFGLEGGVREVSVARGAPLVVRLAGCRTCGFEWEAPNVTPARLISKRYVKPTGKGGNGVFEFVLEYSDGPMTAGVEFSYRRPWETTAAATARLTVHVGGTQDSV